MKPKFYCLFSFTFNLILDHINGHRIKISFLFVFILDFKEVLLFFLLRFKTITRNPYFAPNKTTTTKSFEQKRTLIVDQIKSINKKKERNQLRLANHHQLLLLFKLFRLFDSRSLLLSSDAYIYSVCFQAIFCQYFSLTHCF